MRKIIWIFSASIAVLVTAALVFVVAVSLRVEETEFPVLIGNAPGNIQRLVAATDPASFSFLVVGDIGRGMETFEEMIDVVRGDTPAFMVIDGDFVSHPDVPHHQLFSAEMTELALPFPVLLVPGNHDISPDGPFTLDDFRERYGPAQFYYTIGDYLFIFLNSAPPYSKSGEYLEFMEKVLAAKRDGVRDVFVFMHTPPNELSPRVRGQGLYGAPQFMDLAKKYRVGYVFAGDHHGYWKGVRDGTTYIVSGGGGADLRGEKGRFHHLLRMSVENGTVAETVIAVGHAPGGWDLLEQNIMVYVWPLIEANMASKTAALLIGISAVLLLWYSFRRLT